MQLSSLMLLALALASTTIAMAQQRDASRDEPGPDSRIIVKLRGDTDAPRAQAQAARKTLDSVASRTNINAARTTALGSRLHVMEIGPGATGESIEATLARLNADSAVEYAELDQRRYAHAIPDDFLYAQQWYLQAPTAALSAIDAEHGWDITTGSEDVVVAFLDTGVLFDHPDLRSVGVGGRLLPGYDFVSPVAAANDGDGRDADATDPGDWVSAADRQNTAFAGCQQGGSSWHGTRVAGIIGARSNNADGIAGVAWQPWLLPVRVLGKCGGRDSDILAAMLWAAGIHVDGVPDNPFPAQVLNLSLGGQGSCPRAYQDVIEEIASRGGLVVVSAGNDGGPVESPANCPGVAGIAGLRHTGTKVGYSSLGPQIALSAPAGNCVNTSGACRVFDRDGDERRHDDADDSRVHRPAQLQRRHELLGADRRRNRGADGVREPQSRSGSADRAVTGGRHETVSRSVGLERAAMSRARVAQRHSECRVQLHDGNLRCRDGERVGRALSGASAGRGGYRERMHSRSAAPSRSQASAARRPPVAA